MTQLRIVFTGAAGTGKSTAISRLSDCDRRSARADDKKRPKGAIDYAELPLSNGRRVTLLSAPSGERFDFMRRCILRDGHAVVLMIDSLRPDPLADLVAEISALDELFRAGRVVVGIGGVKQRCAPSIAQYADVLAAMGAHVPVIGIDVQRREDLLRLLYALLVRIDCIDTSKTIGCIN